MAVLGILLVLLGAGVGVFAYLGVADETGRIQVSALGVTRDAAPIELVILGALGMLLIALGWAAVAGSARRAGRRRREDAFEQRLSAQEERAAEDRATMAAQFEQAQLRDEDFTRRERELSARHDSLDGREQQLALRSRELDRLEDEWRGRMSPSVADVVAGRAEGSVADGTARWLPRDGRVAGNGRTDTSTQQLPQQGPDDRTSNAPTQEMPRQ